MAELSNWKNPRGFSPSTGDRAPTLSCVFCGNDVSVAENILHDNRILRTGQPRLHGIEQVGQVRGSWFRHNPVRSSTPWAGFSVRTGSTAECSEQRNAAAQPDAVKLKVEPLKIGNMLGSAVGIAGSGIDEAQQLRRLRHEVGIDCAAGWQLAIEQRSELSGPCRTQ